MEVTLYSQFYTKISFKDPELIYWRSFEMNGQQIYRGSSLYVGWMRDTLLVYDNSLPPYA